MKKLSPPAAEFVICFLATSLSFSLVLNVVMVAERKHPSLWNDLRLSFKSAPPVRPSDHVFGPSGRALTIIEYSDFECPFSKQMHSELKHLAETSRVRWVSRNRPLDSIHPFAVKAAIAAECAGAQNKFWDYSDALFSTQEDGHSEAYFDGLARRCHLNLAMFNQCQSSPAISTLLRRQMSEADALEVSATPTIFVNGKRFTGAVPYSELSSLAEKFRGME